MIEGVFTKLLQRFNNGRQCLSEGDEVCSVRDKWISLNRGERWAHKRIFWPNECLYGCPIRMCTDEIHPYKIICKIVFYTNIYGLIRM